MDEVLCDFKTSYHKKYHETENKYRQSEYGFFLELTPLSFAIDSVKILEKHFDVWILSRPSVHNIMCYSEKAYWIRKHLGFHMQEKLILCTDKSLLKGDYLIDDQIGSGQENFEGELIRFGVGETSDWLQTVKFILDKENINDYNTI